jgi:hypothetical protein
MQTLTNITIATTGTPYTDHSGAQGTVTRSTLDEVLEYIANEFGGEGLKTRVGVELKDILGRIVDLRIEGDDLLGDLEPLATSELGQALLKSDAAQITARLEGAFRVEAGEVTVVKIRSAFLTGPAIDRFHRDQQVLRACKAATEEAAHRLTAHFAEQEELQARRDADRLKREAKERRELAIETDRAARLAADRKVRDARKREMHEAYRRLCAETR